MLLCLAAGFGAQSQADLVYQIPLAVGTNVPGNLLIVPSVEHPTVNSVANLDDSYDEDSEYVGYFDPDKCYKYEYVDADDDGNHFYPSSSTDDHRCSGDDEWSGNYLDWAATQTIDPFRKALTGGYRFRDTESETWLQKARSDSYATTYYYPDRTLSDSSVIAGATPFTATSFKTVIRTLGNEMQFTVSSGYSYQGGDTSSTTIFEDSGSGTWTSASASSSGPGQYGGSSSSSVVSSTSTRYYSSGYSLLVSSSSSSQSGGGNQGRGNQGGSSSSSSSSAYQSLDESLSELNFTFSGWLYSASSSTDMVLSVEGSGGGYGVKFTSSGIYIVKVTNGSAGTLASGSWSSSYPTSAWFQFKLEATTSDLTLTVYDSSGNEIGSVTTSDSSYSSFTKVVIYTGSSTWYADDLLVSTSTTDLPFEATSTANTFLVNVRVKVCDADVGVEDNCVKYDSGYYKPEGLLQEYADSIRVGVISYLDDSTYSRDGGVLRANMKFVGQTIIETDGTESDNDYAEWDPDTGVLVQNPNPDDATNTDTGDETIEYSGVINYLNDFGELTTANHKSKDPVSELYYTAIRYYRNLGDVSAYSELSGTDSNKYLLADAFPVITDWDDPIQYYCQTNAILGIGDVYTWYDKNLYGTISSSNEPSMPSEVSSDTSMNVNTVTQKVASMEGITISTPYNSSRSSSAYIAGLAYYWHTHDMRSTISEDQTITTYWVDVAEGQVIAPITTNQYYLATKYGGFEIPDDFDPDADTTTSLDDSWWSSGEELDASDGSSFDRPETYFVASGADAMVESLESAFSDIVGEATGSSSSVAANSTSLDENTVIYQARYSSDYWSGDLRAYLVDSSTGEVADDYKWSASEVLPDWDSRTIYVYNPDGSGSSSQFTDFDWDNLSSDQQTALGSEAVVDYLRGDTSAESPSGDYRERDGLIGDIVNSTPIYVSSATASLYKSASFTGASDWSDYVEETEDRIAAIYVGANGGMLHGFRADTGKELFAFVPNTVILNNGMSDLSDTEYDHVYFVDGELTIADVYVSAEWKTVLIGTLGRGGPGVFALDVTKPKSPKFLWELNADDIPALGRNIGKPIIAQIDDENWQVILGNGPDSTGGLAQLVMINISTGEVTTVSTEVGGTGDDDLNGLSAVYTWDSDGDDFADTVYAGDLQGNLWKFTNLTADEPSFEILFGATDPDGDSQSIQAAPLVGEDSDDDDQVWVFFGTGQYLNKNDIADIQVQTWYGIKDADDGKTLARSDLAEREIEYETTVDDTGVRVITQSDEDGIDEIDDYSGWRIDLVSPVNGEEGERMVVPNTFKGTALIGTTRIPDSSDSCETGGTSWSMAIDPFTGTALSSSFYDVDGDSDVSDSDTITIDGTTYVVSGIGFSSGSNGSTFVGSAMEVSLDDATVSTVMTSSSSTDSERTSWHEVINE